MDELEVHSARDSGLPMVWVRPDDPAPATRLALWLTHLGGSKEQTIPMLRRLAAAGCVALSFDPWRHGERGSGEDGRALAGQVFAGFRRHMWPILGHTTLDCLQALDWALQTIAPEATTVVAGGISMGGDVSVALAGIDSRISRVAALVATPDWTRPGMRAIDDPDTVIDQGAPGAAGRWYYEHLDPATHLDRYRRGPHITFECGAQDTHVPPDGAVRFRDRLADLHPEAGRRVRVDLHAGAGHLDGGGPEFTDAAVTWLADGID